MKEKMHRWMTPKWHQNTSEDFSEINRELVYSWTQSRCWSWSKKKLEYSPVLFQSSPEQIKVNSPFERGDCVA